MKHQLAALAEVAKLLDRSGLNYWLFGGWAVDFHVGTVTRDHEDIDLAVWLDDAGAVESLLRAHAWQHKPHPGEDGGTGYERGPVRLELTYLTCDETLRVFVPLREHSVLWSEDPLGNEVRELLSVRARVLPLALLRSDKSLPRPEPDDAAKDRADFEALARLSS